MNNWRDRDMFDMKKEVIKWRKSLLKNEAMEDGYIAELESHLYDEIERLKESGLSEQEAFQKAVKDVGSPDSIGNEYLKTDAREIPGNAFWNPSRFMPALLWSYVKISLRKIRRQKGYSIINIAGLAVGLVCCILMILWVQDELSFDRFHKNGKDIYRVISEIHSTDRVTLNARTPNPLGPTLLSEYQEIINFVRFQGFDGWPVKAGDKIFFNDNLGTADPSFFKVFTFPFVKGDPRTALKDRYSIVITESMAQKYFGDEDPMGKVIQIGDDFIVTGIIKDLPANSHLQFDCIFPIINMTDYWHENFEDWRRIRFYTYVQLEERSSAEDVNQKISKVINKHLPRARHNILLQPLKDVHLKSNFEWDLDNFAQGSIVNVTIFTLTALGILLLACINFMNLATARSSGRAKEVGMRKVSGAHRIDLMKQFYGESLILAGLSLILALFLTEALLPVFNNLTGKTLSLNPEGNVQFIFGLFFVTVLTGIISGSYPALVLSAFRSANVLKGAFLLPVTKGGHMRKILVIFQFTATIILIVITSIIFLQLRFVQTRDLGFDKDHIMTFHLAHADTEVLRNSFFQIPNVLTLTFSREPGDLMGVTGFDWEEKNPDVDIMLYPVEVDYDYLKTFQMEMVQGRFFSREFTTDGKEAVVINETAARVMGFKDPVGKRLSNQDREGTIIGVIKDFHHSSLHNPIEPMVLWFPEEFYQVCVRINPENVPQTLALMESAWKKLNTGYPFSYEFLDKKINDFYQKELKTFIVFRYFSLIALFIACLGLFGLSSYTAEQRTKEIGIRKVLGASVSRIVAMLSKEFTRWVLIANMFACPAAYFISRKWLQSFAYRIPIGWEIFIFALVFSFGLALLTVSYQAIKAARTNPVESLRYE
jgi:putative ABC transport system permease protein